MRIQITHLKAPWPAGAVVGDVLDLPAVPVWAVGKCKPVGDDVALTIVTGDGPGEALLPIDDDEQAKIAAALAEAEKQHAEEVAAIEADEAPKRKAK